MKMNRMNERLEVKVKRKIEGKIMKNQKSKKTKKCTDLKSIK